MTKNPKIRHSFIQLMTKLLLATGLFLVVACESVGTIEAVSNGERVNFDYQQNYDEHDGVLTITMPDGEHFSGKFVQSSTATSDDGFDVSVDIELGNDDTTDERVVLEQSDRVSSEAEALLIGDKGNTMSCRFLFSQPDDGIDGGGIGTCKVSNGRVVNATF